MNGFDIAETGLCPVDPAGSACIGSLDTVSSRVNRQVFRTGEEPAIREHIEHISEAMTLEYLQGAGPEFRWPDLLQGKRAFAKQQSWPRPLRATPEPGAAFFRVHEDMDRSQALNAHLSALDLQVHG
jgi:hypothetical protein